MLRPTMLRYVALTCCDRLAGALSVAMCCDVLGVVGSNLAIFKVEPATPNTSQQGGQTHATCCAQQCCAKRSQHANATYRNIVGRNMLRAFGHLVATCCDVLGVVGSNLTIFKPEPTTPNMSQHIATRWPSARSMLCPTMLQLRWYVAIVWPGFNIPTQHIATLFDATCCVRLPTVLRCVATCWVLSVQI